MDNDSSKKNIYGDIRSCFKCKKKADIIEKGKDYCAECWFQIFSGTTIQEYGNLIIERGFNDKSRINQK